jgi:AcrR family transcriptional regulator
MAKLLRLRAVERISIRDVAEQAGVNHGLVHRHFGSKSKLVAAAVAKLSADVHRGNPEHAAMSVATFLYFLANPDVPRLVARACLDGPRQLLEHAAPPPERLAEIVGLIRSALERMGLADQVDPHLLNAVASSALLGWCLFRPLLDRGFGLPRDADEQLLGLLQQLDRLLLGIGRDAGA